MRQGIYLSRRWTSLLKITDRGSGKWQRWYTGRFPAAASCSARLDRDRKKTISALFPSIKALGEGKAERIFYLTAKTIARQARRKPYIECERQDFV
jgi:hypothetical protein